MTRVSLVQPSGNEPATDWVRELAFEIGRSERTIWRWLAASRNAGRELEIDRECDYCGEPLPDDATVRRRYCGDACRVAAHRERRSAEDPTNR